MKSLFMLVALVISVGAHAQNQLYLSTGLKKLDRAITFTVAGEELFGGFTSSNGMEAFYRVGNYDEEAYFKISEVNKKLHVEILSGKTLISFTAPMSPNGTVTAKKQQVELSNERQTPNHLTQWYDLKVIAEQGEVAVSYKNIFGKNPIAKPITLTSALEFNGCDGCEHGDQFMVGNVNVVEVGSMGEYYLGDCPGTVEPLLEKLLSKSNDGLGVPFTFTGFISMDTTDYFDEVGQMWVGDSQGQLFIGHTTKLPVARFLDSLIVRAAQELKVEAHSIWADVVKHGKFAYKNDLLTFKYKTVVIKTNLKTATTVL